MNKINLTRIFVITMIGMFSVLCNGQIMSPSMKSDTSFKNNLGIGVSYGTVINKEADFWGLSVSYLRVLNEKWSISPSLSFDQENDHILSIDNPRGKLTNTFTFISTITYNLSPQFSLTTGLAKGFLDDSNPQNKLAIANGDWGTGIAVGYVLPFFKNWEHGAISISSALEYNLSGKDWTMSFDLGYGYSF